MPCDDIKSLHPDRNVHSLAVYSQSIGNTCVYVWVHACMRVCVRARVRECAPLCSSSVLIPAALAGGATVPAEPKPSHRPSHTHTHSHTGVLEFIWPHQRKPHNQDGAMTQEQQKARRRHLIGGELAHSEPTRSPERTERAEPSRKKPPKTTKIHWSLKGLDRLPHTIHTSEKRIWNKVDQKCFLPILASDFRLRDKAEREIELERFF